MQVVNSVQQTNLKNRIEVLDSLRGIAALMVVTCHLLFMRKGFEFVHVFSYFGVALFFLISGFVITLTIKPYTSVKHFLINRFSRLYPAYWASVVLIVAISFVMNKGHITNQQTVLANITMFQNWFFIKDIDGTYWTLHVEMAFYLLMALLIIIKQVKNIIPITEFFLLALSFFYMAQQGSYFGTVVQKVNYLLPVANYFSYFFAGICFCSLYRNGSNIYIHLAILASLILCAYTLPFFQNVKLNLLPYLLYFFLLIGIFIIFYLLIYQKLSFLNNYIFNFFGRISYSMYITHFYLSFCFIIPVLEARGVNWVIVRAITIPIIVFLAYCVNRFIELPAMLFIRNKFLKQQA